MTHIIHVGNSNPSHTCKSNNSSINKLTKKYLRTDIRFNLKRDLILKKQLDDQAPTSQLFLTKLFLN